MPNDPTIPLPRIVGEPVTESLETPSAGNQDDTPLQ